MVSIYSLSKERAGQNKEEHLYSFCYYYQFNIVASSGGAWLGSQEHLMFFSVGGSFFFSGEEVEHGKWQFAFFVK